MSTKDMKQSQGRRQFLRVGGISILGGLMAGSPAFLGSALANSLSLPTLPPVPNSGAAPNLTLNNIHTGEHLNCVFSAENSYDRNTLDAINRLMRDHRTGDIHTIDPNLLDMMNAIADHLQVAPNFEVISGYRSARTNQALRNKSRNVARKSYHMLGQAADLRMPGISTTQLHQAALTLRAGGVGLYRGSGFIHVDTGPVRAW